MACDGRCGCVGVSDGSDRSCPRETPQNPSIAHHSIAPTRHFCRAPAVRALAAHEPIPRRYSPLASSLVSILAHGKVQRNPVESLPCRLLCLLPALKPLPAFPPRPAWGSGGDFLAARRDFCPPRAAPEAERRAGRVHLSSFVRLPLPLQPLPSSPFPSPPFPPICQEYLSIHLVIYFREELLLGEAPKAQAGPPLSPARSRLALPLQPRLRGMARGSLARNRSLRQPRSPLSASRCTFPICSLAFCRL